MSIFLHHWICRFFTIAFLYYLFCLPSVLIGSSDYNKLISTLKENRESRHYVENLASGIAGLTIGLYGYYNDDRGIAAKVIYTATQSAGVLLIGEAIESQYTKNLYLLFDKFSLDFDQENKWSIEKFKKELVEAHRTNQKSTQLKIAYTSGILSGLYLYNGIRERSNNKSLSNIQLFFSFNAAMISLSSFYNTYQKKSEKLLEKEVKLSFLPYLALSYHF